MVRKRIDDIANALSEGDHLYLATDPDRAVRKHSAIGLGNIVVFSGNAYKYGGHSGGPSWRYDTTSGKDYVEGIHSTSSRTSPPSPSGVGSCRRIKAPLTR